jgi:glycosyltransferase involved in cell wall biosynthesis
LLSKKRVLFVAFHYPPVAYSSGVHRTLSFTREFDAQGWDVAVLTANEKCYQSIDVGQKKAIPSSVKVIRAWAKDAIRDLSIKGKYFRFMSLPDRYQTWVFGGFFSGIFHILKRKPSVIVSTYPLASAHLIAYLLHKISGITWVADFRDPMAQENFPADPVVNRCYRFIEKLVFKHADHFVFVTNSARNYYQQRFPNVPEEKFSVIANGFDEHFFHEVERNRFIKDAAVSDKIVFLHSGLIYPLERDPTQLFTALNSLKTKGIIAAENFSLRLRATGHDLYIENMVYHYDIADIVEVCPPIGYLDALKEMMSVDVLLLMQAENCNDQIPAKAYEYIRVRKPILALTAIEGETANLIGDSDSGVVAPLDNSELIAEAINNMLHKDYLENYRPSDNVDKYSRHHSAVALIDLFTRLLKN